MPVCLANFAVRPTPSVFQSGTILFENNNYALTGHNVRIGRSKGTPRSPNHKREKGEQTRLQSMYYIL
jgi:hypothetical protein